MSAKREVEFQIRTQSWREDSIELRISRERLARALVTVDEPNPMVLYEFWGNGDSARIVFERIRWRDTEWRQTELGFIKGPYRVWQTTSAQSCVGGLWEVTFNGEAFAHGPFESLEGAQRAAMRHAEFEATEASHYDVVLETGDGAVSTVKNVPAAMVADWRKRGCAEGIHPHSVVKSASPSEGC